MQSRHQLFGQNPRGLEADDFGEYARVVQFPASLHGSLPSHLLRSSSLGFYLSFLPESDENRILQIVSQPSTRKSTSFLKSTLGLRLIGRTRNYQRHCRTCAEEERAKTGLAYWHVVHQLPGVTHCPRHQTPLQGQCITCGYPQSAANLDYAFWYLPSHNCLQCGGAHFEHSKRVPSKAYIQFLTYCENLTSLNRGHEFRPDQLQRKYADLLSQLSIKEVDLPNAIARLTLHHWEVGSFTELSKTMECEFDETFIINALKGTDESFNATGHLILLATLVCEIKNRSKKVTADYERVDDPIIDTTRSALLGKCSQIVETIFMGRQYHIADDSILACMLGLSTEIAVQGQRYFLPVQNRLEEFGAPSHSLENRIQLFKKKLYSRRDLIASILQSYAILFAVLEKFNRNMVNLGLVQRDALHQRIWQDKKRDAIDCTFLDLDGELKSLEESEDVPDQLRWKLESHFLRRTILGFYLMFGPQENEENLARVFARSKLASEKMPYLCDKPELHCFPRSEATRRICRECMEEHSLAGPTYRNTVHQLPGVLHCPKHLSRLEERCDYCDPRELNYGAYFDKTDIHLCSCSNRQKIEITPSKAYTKYLTYCEELSTIQVTEAFRPHILRARYIKLLECLSIDSTDISQAVRKMILRHWEYSSLTNLSLSLGIEIDEVFFMNAIQGMDITLNANGHLVLLSALECEIDANKKTYYVPGLAEDPLIEMVNRNLTYQAELVRYIVYHGRQYHLADDTILACALGISSFNASQGEHFYPPVSQRLNRLGANKVPQDDRIRWYREDLFSDDSTTSFIQGCYSTLARLLRDFSPNLWKREAPSMQTFLSVVRRH